MTDHKKSTGSSGTMMIRDTGTVVEFWLNSNNNSTFNHQLGWGYTINGVTNNDREWDYKAGAGWDKLGSWTVSTDQTVTFRLSDSGTSGFGGPTTFSVIIDRASVPSAPTKPIISEITASSMRLRWTAGAANGAAINLYQVARNVSNTLKTATVFNVDTDTVMTGLAAGTTYYWWSRTRNAKGYSAWSPVSYATTIKTGDAPDQPVLSDATQTSFVVSFTENGNGGSAILERQISFNTTDTTVGAMSIPYDGVMTIGTLQPATTYFVWARVRNAAGWGPYSPVATITTVAGACVIVGGEIKQAVPYVKTGGLWKIAQPFSRIAGLWKKTE